MGDRGDDHHHKVIGVEYGSGFVDCMHVLERESRYVLCVF